MRYYMELHDLHKHLKLAFSIFMLSACHPEHKAMDSHYSINADPLMYNIEEVADLLRISVEGETKLNISRFNEWHAYDGVGNLTHWIAYSDCYEASLFSIPRRIEDDHQYTLSFYYQDCDESETVIIENLFIKLISDIDGIFIEKEF